MCLFCPSWLCLCRHGHTFFTHHHIIMRCFHLLFGHSPPLMVEWWLHWLSESVGPSHDIHSISQGQLLRLGYITTTLSTSDADHISTDSTNNLPQGPTLVGPWWDFRGPQNCREISLYQFFWQDILWKVKWKKRRGFMLGVVFSFGEKTINVSGCVFYIFN